MNEAIERAAHPNATETFVLIPTNVTTSYSNDGSSSRSGGGEVPTCLNSNPEDASVYFSALLNDAPAIKSTGGIVGLLALPVTQFVLLAESGSDGSDGGSSSISQVDAEQARMYMEAVARHVDALLDAWSDGTNSARVNIVSEILRAVGSAASLCRNCRSEISSCGILPALAKLAVGYQCNQSNPSNQSAENHLSHQTGTDSTSPNTQSPPSKKQTTNTNATNGTENYENYDNYSDIFTSAFKPLSKNIFNPAHTEFLQCCLLASQYRYASKFVKANPILALPSPSMKSTSKHHHDLIFPAAPFNRTSQNYLRYFYYLGMIHLGCDDYNSAISAFHVCLTVPSQIISSITIAARKKMMLAHCLLLEQDNFDEEDTLANSHLVTRHGHAGEGTVMKKNHNLAQIITALPNATSPNVTASLSLPATTSSNNNPISLSASTSTAPASNVAPSSIGSRTNHLHSNNQDGSAADELDIISSSDDVSEVARRNASTINTTSTMSTSTSTLNSNPSHHHGLYQYHDLVTNFANLQSTQFQQCMENNTVLWQADGNLGLVKKLNVILHQRAVKKIGRVYKVIPLQKVGDMLGLHSKTCHSNDNGNTEKATEELLFDIATKQYRRKYVLSSTDSSAKLISHSPVSILEEPLIDFRVDMETSMVYFNPDDDFSGEDEEDHYCNSRYDAQDINLEKVAQDDIQKQITQRILSCMELADRISKLDIALATSPKYQNNLWKEQQMAGSGGGVGGRRVGGIGSGPRGVSELA